MFYPQTCRFLFSLKPHPQPFTRLVPSLAFLNVHPPPCRTRTTLASRYGLGHRFHHHPMKVVPQENSTDQHSKAPSAWKTHVGTYSALWKKTKPFEVLTWTGFV